MSTATLDTSPTIPFDFTGRVGIVTGSAGEIGQAYAEALVAASALVADIDEGKAAAVAAGIRSAAAAAMAEAAVDHFGGIDYLVNNVAIFGGMRLVRP
jgi:3-oxoacyl-[acyl-carrier protein] reductase